jgi:hypothetical protein
MFTCQMYGYTVSVFYVTKIPGNRFVNGIFFGVAEVSSMFISGYLLEKLPDITVYNIFAVNGIFAATVLAFFPSDGLYIYLITFCLVCTAGGWFNCHLIIIEMRVPPKSLSS